MTISMKQARVGVNKSQTAMAEEMGVSIGTYRKWELDPGDMPIKAAKKFCGIVGLPFDSIYFA